MSLRLVAWGTYDVGKPRVRILLEGLRQAGVVVAECHRHVWSDIEDKSQINGLRPKVRLLLRWLTAYPYLIYRYLREPAHDAVLVGYMGQLDVLILWPFARLRGTPIIWDAFLSLYNTVVEDRRLVSRHHPVAYLLFALEWLACRAVDAVVLDTAAHGQYFIDTFRVHPSRVHRVFVGVEPEAFHPARMAETRKAPGEQFRVLFYGQFIPLHGVETIVRAAKLTETDGIQWQLVGTGQEAERIHRLITDLSPANLEWVQWVPYERLLDEINRADACLGIFGATDKAARVIPNKVFQIIASGRPLITADTPAIREILRPGPDIKLVAPADPDALRRAVLWLRASAPAAGPGAHIQLRKLIQPIAVVQPLKDLLERVARAAAAQRPA